MGEDDRVEDSTKPDWEEAKDTLDLFDLGDGAEAPGVSKDWLSVEGGVVVIGVNYCCSVQEPSR